MASAEGRGMCRQDLFGFRNRIKKPVRPTGSLCNNPRNFPSGVRSYTALEREPASRFAHYGSLENVTSFALARIVFFPHSRVFRNCSG